MKNKRKSFTRITIPIASAVIFVAAAVFVITNLSSREASAYAGRERRLDGAVFIREKEAVPTGPIENQIAEEELEESATLSEKEIEELLAEPDKIFTELNKRNTVLIGESRTSGFSASGFMDESHVLGGIGWSIQEIPSLYETLENMQPKNIVFSFGINELGRYPDTPVYYYEPKIFIDDLNERIEAIKERIPDVNIYINCIVPCTDAVYEEYPGYAVIPEWNRKLEKNCEKKGYRYIEISDLCKEHADMYIEDGIHFIADFYPYWGERILEAVLENEQ